jgi:hypothetical protein
MVAVSLMVAVSPRVAPPEARANPRRTGGMFTASLGAGTYVPACEGCEAGLSTGGLFRLGGLFPGSDDFAVHAELAVFQSWHDGIKRGGGALLLGASAWAGERISMSLGLGGALAEDPGSDDSARVSGAAVHGSLGVDVHHWRRSALVVRASLLGADHEAGWGTSALVVIGFDGFGHVGD